MLCTKCKNPKIHRIEREGFLRTTLAPIFGYYPWECSNCGKVQLLKSRGNRRRSRKVENARLEVRRHAAGQSRQAAAD
jgi:hypothetical protein